MEFELKVLDQFVNEEGSAQEQECWLKIKSAMSLNLSDVVRSLIEEAKAISENHPSKDARFFADKVYRFLSEHFS